MICKLTLALAAGALLAGQANAALVLADDFDDADGTAINGKAADIGGPWSETGGATVNSGIFDTTGAARTAFADFTTALGAGQVLTMVVDTAPSSFFNSGWAGVSLYVGGAERVFVGDASAGSNWAVDGGVTGLNFASPDNADADNTATFTYTYDTGAWSLELATGESVSGTGPANEAFDQVRVANNDGGDIAIDALTVDISQVPEPGSLALLALGGLMIARRRRA